MVSIRCFILLALLAVWMPATCSASVEREQRIRGLGGGRPTPQSVRRKAHKKSKGTVSEDLPTAAPVDAAPVDAPLVPDSTKTPSVPPTKEPTLEVPKGTKEPSLSTSEPTSQTATSPEPQQNTPTTEGGEDPSEPQEPQPSPIVEATPAPLMAPVPSIAPAPSDSSNVLSPSEIAAEESRTRALLPFSLEISGQFRVDDVDQVLEMFLFQRLSTPFSNLEWILLTVTSSEEERTRRARSLVEKTFDFTGIAIFLESDDIPTEPEVQRAQLKALQDFHLLGEFIVSQDFDWEIETIILDGMTIDEDGIVLGDMEMENDGDTLVRGVSGDSTEDDNGVALALSLIAVFVLLGIGGYVARGKIQRNRMEEAKTPEAMETLEGLMETNDEGQAAKNTSYEASTLETTRDSSMNVSGTSEYRTESSSMMDWNRVFALSQTPVEQTYGEVFEPKQLEPPKEENVREIVTLAPLREGREELQVGEETTHGDELQVGEEEMPGDEDSYGYTSFDLDDGINEDFVLSSPVAPGQAGDADPNYGENKDITIDLADFVSENG
jgi:hypothetical protein